MGAKVSIIIPTLNSASTLPIVLRSAFAQTYRDVEVIVVDGGSRDGSVEIAKRMGARVYVTKANRSFQRNFGAAKSAGDILYFVDSDCYISPQVVEECVDLIRGGADAVIVWNIVSPRGGLVAKLRFFERMSYYGSGVYEAARCVKRGWFFKVGGFDPSLYTNEDYDFHSRLLRAGAKVARTAKGFEIDMGNPSSLREFVIKSAYYGVNIGRYVEKNPRLEHIIPVRPSFFSRWFVSWATRRWPPAVAAVSIFKFIQAAAFAVGLLLRPRVNPYGSPSQ